MKKSCFDIDMVLLSFASFMSFPFYETGTNICKISPVGL